jgi:hypothetical protein
VQGLRWKQQHGAQWTGLSSTFACAYRAELRGAHVLRRRHMRSAGPRKEERVDGHLVHVAAAIVVVVLGARGKLVLLLLVHLDRPHDERVEQRERNVRQLGVGGVDGEHATRQPARGRSSRGKEGSAWNAEEQADRVMSAAACCRRKLRTSWAEL